MKSPNHLYPLLTCTAQVLLKDDSTNTVTLSNIPTGWDGEIVSPWTNNTGVNATTVDLITPEPPFNFRKYADTGLPTIDCPIIAINTTTKVLQLDPLTYASVQLGDFIATNGSCGQL